MKGRRTGRKGKDERDEKGEKEISKDENKKKIKSKENLLYLLCLEIAEMEAASLKMKDELG